MFIKKRFSKKNERNEEPTLFELVADHRNFKGWNAVYQRVLSHPDEVRVRHSGWYPLEHACYNHPDYAVEPAPENVVKAFIAIDPQSAFWAILEACRNPLTLEKSLEALLLAADKQYFDIHAERDFNQIVDLNNVELEVCYVKIANRKGLGWENGLQLMMTTIHADTAPSLPIIGDILSVSIELKRQWNDGLRQIFTFAFSKLESERKIDILRQCVGKKWACDEDAFKYILAESWDLMRDNRAKRYLLIMGINSGNWEHLHQLLRASQSFLEDEEGRPLLRNLFYNASVSSKRFSLSLVFYLLREFPSLNS
jgi:hypothetical protein